MALNVENWTTYFQQYTHDAKATLRIIRRLRAEAKSAIRATHKPASDEIGE